MAYLSDMLSLLSPLIVLLSLRGEDAASLPVRIAVPQLAVQMNCTVDNTTCGQYIGITMESEVKYTVTLNHL